MPAKETSAENSPVEKPSRLSYSYWFPSSAEEPAPLKAAPPPAEEPAPLMAAPPKPAPPTDKEAKKKRRQEAFARASQTKFPDSIYVDKRPSAKKPAHPKPALPKSAPPKKKKKSSSPKQEPTVSTRRMTRSATRRL